MLRTTVALLVLLVLLLKVSGVFAQEVRITIIIVKRGLDKTEFKSWTSLQWTSRKRERY